MKPMLSAVSRPGFSETAGSCPGHDKARGCVNHFLAGAIFARRDLDDVVKRPAEGAEAAEADVQADISDASLGFTQQEHGALHPPSLQVAVRGLAKGRLEGPDEVRFGNRSDLRQVCYVQRL